MTKPSPLAPEDRDLIRVTRLYERQRLADRVWLTLFIVSLAGWLTFLWYGTWKALEGSNRGREGFGQQGVGVGHGGKIP